MSAVFLAAAAGGAEQRQAVSSSEANTACGRSVRLTLQLREKNVEEDLKPSNKLHLIPVHTSSCHVFRIDH